MQTSIRIEEIAADWVARRAGNQWSAADEAALSEWLEASVAHRVAFVRLDAAWREAGRLKALRTGAGDVPGPGAWVANGWFRRIEPREARQAGARKARRWAIAAAALLAITIPAAWFLVDPRGDEYSTVVGGLQTVPLSDGSQVTLNTDTDIRVAITSKERLIELQQGEALFEVARDPSRPFVVRAGDRRVVVVGTIFSVLREGESFRVVVREGEVRVEDIRPRPTQPAAKLTAGHVARGKSAALLIQQKPLDHVEELLTWRSGFIVFRETTLAEAIGEFNRYNERKIAIEDPSIAGIRIDGHFRPSNVDAFLRLLEEGFPISADRRPDRVVLTASGRN